MENNFRKKIVADLENIYDYHGINPDNFRCKNLIDCNNDSLNKIHYRGAQAHVGNLYGVNKRVLILSLDQGGGASVITERTSIIENLNPNKLNPHMRGTIEFLRCILPKVNDAELLQSFAMTNSAKCSGITTEKLPTPVYQRCVFLHELEIKSLQPELILSQGVDAIPHFLKPICVSNDEIISFVKSLNPNPLIMEELNISIKNTFNRYIRRIEDLNSLLITSPHPSSRNGQWQLFRDISLPIIKLYIDYKANVSEN